MLINKNVNINKRRTSMKLDSQSWNTLHDICKTEKIKLCDLMGHIDNNRGNIGMSLATRIFIISYLRQTITGLKSGKNKPNLSQDNLVNFISIIYKKDTK